MGLVGVWKKLIPMPMDDFGGFKIEVTTEAMEMARESELEVEPEAGTELLRSCDKINEKLLLVDEQGKWLFEIESTTVKIIEMTTRDFEYSINLVVKAAAAGFKKIDSNFERSSLVCKMLSNSITCS